MNRLLSPDKYIKILNCVRIKCKPARFHKLKLIKCKSNYPDLYGKPWGWYEVFPLNKTVGYWSSMNDDLEHTDIDGWNKKAEQLERQESWQKAKHTQE